MDNIEKLEKAGMLGAVRQRQGADDENDTSMDSAINQMSNEDLVANYCGWYLGDEGWWWKLKSKFDKLEELDEE